MFTDGKLLKQCLLVLLVLAPALVLITGIIGAHFHTMKAATAVLPERRRHKISQRLWLAATVLAATVLPVAYAYCMRIDAP